MKGSLNVHSEIGKGSEFSFIFHVDFQFEEIKERNSEENNLNLVSRDRDSNFELINVQKKMKNNNSENSNPSDMNSRRQLKRDENENKIQDIIVNHVDNNKCQCPKILIVDDEKGNRLILGSYCKRLNISYHEAINGLEALESVKKLNEAICCKDYLMVFIDYNMPIMNG